MAQAVRAITIKERLNTATAWPRLSVGDLKQTVPPIVMALLCAVGLLLTVQRANMLRTWPEDFSGRGGFLVESCVAAPALGADQWRCTGRLGVEDEAGTRRSTLVTSLGALASDRPYVGEQIEVFFRPGDRDAVYPVAYRLNEMAMLYLSLLPRLLLFVGAGLWLAGWFLTRNLDADDPLTRDSVRFPQRFAWRSRGLTWIGVAAAALVVNFVLTSRIFGSLGII